MRRSHVRKGNTAKRSRQERAKRRIANNEQILRSLFDRMGLEYDF